MNLAYYPELVIVLLFLAVEASWFVICIVIKIIDMTLCSMSASCQMKTSENYST